MGITFVGWLICLPVVDGAQGGAAVLSVVDFPLRRGRRYATSPIDAVTHRRVDVLLDRKAATLAAWLREHPQVDVVCRDGSAAYAEAIRDGAPQAVQVSDRWHLWVNVAKRSRRPWSRTAAAGTPARLARPANSMNRPEFGTPPCMPCWDAPAGLAGR